MDPGNTPLLAPEAATGLVVRVLGGLSVQVDGTPVEVRGGLRRRLLLALVSAEERPLGVGALEDALWPGAGSAGGTNAIQAHVSRLRRLLDPEGARGQDWIRSRADGYALRADWVDLNAFENAVRRAEADSLVDPVRALTGLGAALALPAEPVQEDFPAWVLLTRRFEHRRRGAEDAWADVAARWGTPGDADRVVELARADPVREVRWIHAMRALARTGRQVQALSLYEEARRQLADEFGLDPSQDVRRMHEAVLRQDPELVPPPRVTVPWAGSGTPYPPTSFHGRQDDLDRLDRLAASGRVLTLLGGNGVGKSRLAAEWVHRSGREGMTRWVDLRGVGEGLVALRMASALGVVPEPTGATRMVDQVLSVGSQLPGLLVLDNADGAGAEVGPLVAALVQAHPELTVLVTSTEPLGVSGERRLPVGPLVLSVSDDGTGPAEVLASARLEPGSSRFTATRIARQAAGMPLAIELLAVNPTVDFDGAPDGTLASLVRAVTDSLPEDCVQLLAGLGQLSVGAPAGLAHAVAALVGRSPARSRRLLSELVAASLVVTTSARTPTGRLTVRHRVLPGVAMAIDGDAAASNDLAYRAVTEWVAGQTRTSFFEPPPPGTSELSEDLATFDAALRWWAEHNPTRMIDLTLRLHDFWHQSGQRPIAETWLRRSLSTDTAPVRRAEVLVHLSLGGGLAGAAQALPLLDEAVAVLRAEGAGSGSTYAVAHAQRAVGRGWRGDLAGFAADLAVARSCAASVGSDWLSHLLDLAEALAWAARRRPSVGITPAIASARALRAMGDVDGAATGLYWASLLAGFAQDPALDAILAEARELADQATPPTRALIAGEVARRALAKGTPDAEEALTGAIVATERAGNLRTASLWRRDLGLVLLAQGRMLSARRQLELAALPLTELDTSGAALAVAGLARLAPEAERVSLVPAAHALAADPNGAPLTPRDRDHLNHLTALLGPAPAMTMTTAEAVAVVRSHLAQARSAG